MDREEWHEAQRDSHGAKTNYLESLSNNFISIDKSVVSTYTLAKGFSFCTSIRYLCNPHYLLSSTLVLWCNTAVGFYKTNIEGWIRDGFTSGGDIVRDHARRCIRAFSSTYGTLEAKLWAILDGVLLARQLGILGIWVKADLIIAAYYISRSGGPWAIQGTLIYIRHLISFDYDTISHIYQEGNWLQNHLTRGWGPSSPPGVWSIWPSSMA